MKGGNEVHDMTYQSLPSDDDMKDHVPERVLQVRVTPTADEGIVHHLVVRDCSPCQWVLPEVRQTREVAGFVVAVLPDRMRTVQTTVTHVVLFPSPPLRPFLLLVIRHEESSGRSFVHVDSQSQQQVKQFVVSVGDTQMQGRQPCVSSGLCHSFVRFVCLRVG